MKEKNLYECHVFVCTNKKEGRECCADKGAASVKDDLKAWAKKKYGMSVRVNNAGCLGQCSKGIAAVIYPKGEWQLELSNTSDDIDHLKKRIDRAMEKPQERLQKDD